MELNMKPIGCKYTCNQLASQNLFLKERSPEWDSTDQGGGRNGINYYK